MRFALLLLLFLQAAFADAARSTLKMRVVWVGDEPSGFVHVAEVAGPWPANATHELDGPIQLASERVPYTEPFETSEVGGAGLHVFVLDTGCAPFALSGRVKDGRSFAEPFESSLGDDNGHGTYAASVILNLAPEATVTCVRVLDSKGSGLVSGAASALAWVAEQCFGRCVVSAPFRPHANSRVLFTVAKRARVPIAWGTRGLDFVGTGASNDLARALVSFKGPGASAPFDALNLSTAPTRAPTLAPSFTTALQEGWCPEGVHPNAASRLKCAHPENNRRRVLQQTASRPQPPPPPPKKPAHPRAFHALEYRRVNGVRASA